MGSKKLVIVGAPVGHVTETAKQVLVHSTYAALSGLAEQAGMDLEPGFFRSQVFLFGKDRGGRVLAMADGSGGAGNLTPVGDQRLTAFQVVQAWARMHLSDKEIRAYDPGALAREALVPYLIRTEGPDDGEPGWLEHLAHSADPLNAGVHFGQSRRGKAIPGALRAALALEVKASAAAWLAILRDDELQVKLGSEAWATACGVLEKGTGFDEELARYRPKRRKAAKAEVAQVAAAARVAIPEPEEVKALPEEPEAAPEPATEREPRKVEAPEWAHKADRVLLASARALADVWRMLWSVFGWRDKRID